MEKNYGAVLEKLPHRKFTPNDKAEFDFWIEKLLPVVDEMKRNKVRSRTFEPLDKKRKLPNRNVKSELMRKFLKKHKCALLFKEEDRNISMLLL